METNFPHPKKPIFIDKPIALSIRNLDKLYQLGSNPNNIFSCSSMSFCPAFENLSNFLQDEKVGFIEFTSPKSWDRYAVHLIDPFIKYLRKLYLNDYSIELFGGKSSLKETSINCSLQTSNHKDPLIISFITTGEISGNLGFHAFNKDKELIASEFHKKPFLSFKRALEKFLTIYSGSTIGYKFDYCHHKEVVKIIQGPSKLIR